MAEMVWCKSCNTVVWAYDHQKPIHLSGVANMLRLACPVCGDRGGFDGWASDEGQVFEEVSRLTGLSVFDWWSCMKAVAAYHKKKWNPSQDNTW